jgi:hypothetical protein
MESSGRYVKEDPDFLILVISTCDPCGKNLRLAWSDWYRIDFSYVDELKAKIVPI